MSKPCPILTNSVFVLAKTGADVVLDKNDDRIFVTEAGYVTESEEIDRSDVHTPEGTGLGPIVAGRRYQFTIVQEVYEDLSKHEVLLKACPVQITRTNDIPTITPSVSLCEDSGYYPCTIEIGEPNGNLYRATNCVGMFSIQGSPGGRLQITFNMTGAFSAPIDNPYSNLTPMLPGPPLIYRNALVQYFSAAATATLNLTTCPSFTFSPNMTQIDIEAGCTPDGGALSYVIGNQPATLAFNGVLAQKNSIDRLWSESINAAGGRVVSANVNQTTSGPIIKINSYSLADPAIGDTQGLVTANLTFSGGDWEIVWPEDPE